MSNTQAMIHPVHKIDDGVINTKNGQIFSLVDPDPKTVKLGDIAFALSNVCRFGGHIEFFSVAQHSVIVSEMAKEHGEPLAIQKAALFHDAAEAYVGDVVKPLKQLLSPMYEEIEDRILSAIFKRFDIDMDCLAEVKKYDKMSVEMEFNHFFKDDSTVFKGYTNLICMPPYSAEKLFHTRFYELQK